MEKKVIEMLDENIAAAQDIQVKDLLRAHRQETKNHVEVLEQVFGAFDWDIDESPCPAIDGLEKEGKATVKKTDESFVDSVILQGAVEVEHQEIGVYTNLILNACAMGRRDVVDLLQTQPRLRAAGAGKGHRPARARRSSKPETTRDSVSRHLVRHA